MTEYLETVELLTGEDPDGAVIWLHGLGADGNDFVPIVPELGLKNLRFVFPHAPVRPVTLNNGMAMRAWFDIRDLTRETMPDKEGLGQTAGEVTKLIERENERGIDTAKIVLAGFSQGGAAALYTALPYAQRLAGIIGLSTWIPVRNTGAAANRNTPIFMGHGEFDPVVNVSAGVETRDLLIKEGYDVVWNTYPMEHAVCPQEIQDVAAFLHRVLPRS
ncbi:MAG: alpha/beta hydrolase [Gammaproteobacteria bacterium]|nr:alpha/beta hydrolase [Gammaproteobacteria bacterium]MDH3767136.1 alpha/beta hydrolase [Gammaproteobacteria bacterium]